MHRPRQIYFDNGLAIASKLGDAAEIQNWLDQGADPKSAYPANDGYTALMLACMRGKVDAVKLLLPLSDPLARNSHGATALMVCARYGHVGAARLLLPVSDLDERDEHGESALDAAKSCENPGVAKLIEMEPVRREAQALRESLKRRSGKRAKAPRI